MRRAAVGIVQLVVALGCVIGASWIHYLGRTAVEGEFWLLLGLAFVVGLVLGRWWALLLAPLPWLAGVGYGLYTGRYLFLGDAWQVIWLGSASLTLIGIALGWGVNRALTGMRFTGTERSRTL